MISACMCFSMGKKAAFHVVSAKVQHMYYFMLKLIAAT